MEKFICESDWPVVNTDKGKVRGYYYDGNYIFKGIPYAKAARFKQPVEADAWDGIRDATNYG